VSGVLDASALLALLQDEPGAELVAEALPGASISTVNLAEVLYKSAAKGIDPSVLVAGLGRLGLRVEPFELADAVIVASLHGQTRRKGLSLGDLACLALGQRRRERVLHAEHAWVGLDLGITLRHIRGRAG
jgi:PIN domain nuclease of toxin-antitoxin system